MSVKESLNDNYSIVVLEKFIQATRDSGYKGTASAVSEIVDNSIQAGATKIRISLELDEKLNPFPIVIRIHDNGIGMDQRTLRQALRFGGTTRFNNRNGMGRYGMGLPNSSFSQAQRVTVQTWTNPKHVQSSYLDINEISSGNIDQVPPPQELSQPIHLNGDSSGTIVTWERCDRLDNIRIPTIIRKLKSAIGRRFRYYIWKGTDITINEEQIKAIDPLYLNPNSVFSGASQFGKDSYYTIRVNVNDSETTGIVQVRFSELPVAEWSKLSNKEKHAIGISKGSGVSIIMAGFF